MDKQKMKNNRRKITIFIAGVNILAWLAWSFAAGSDMPEARDLGLLIWLVSPFLLSLLIRLFSRDWRDIGLGLHLKGNLRWYIASIITFPVIVTLVLGLGCVMGAVSFDSFDFSIFLAAVGAIFVSTLVKNVFEEFAWRGFLTPKVNAVVKRPVWGHLLVGFFWGCWHIPYYLGLLDRVTLNSYTPLDLGAFIPLVVLGITLAGIMFGEMRLLTNSTWPALLMHTVSNVIIVTLLVDNFIEIKEPLHIFFTPSWEGILTMFLVVIAGLRFLGKRRSANK
jgi:membrane protease YdiL (CAAX protease family)